MTRALELTNQKFERLTVISRAENSKQGQTRWNCVCDCGNESTVAGTSIIKGLTKSCGCLNKEKIGALNLSHGQTVGRKTTKTLNSWRGMKARCDNPNDTRYHMYGGRGIGYQESWASFEKFYADMGDRPEGMSLERIDVNGNYCKENCKWETLSRQAYNINLRKDNPSGRTGVKKSQSGLRWKASIRHENINYHLGTFDTFEEAVTAREEAEMKFYGYTKQ